MTGANGFLKKNECTVVWAAFRDRNFWGMLEISFEHSEIRIAFQQAASEVTKNHTKSPIFLHISK